ncbi:DUF4126 family protein [Hymenobacter tibetensis]|uniref:DUF4126 family protein n=1 Tax=Hymenobacter tibetensis TaxID=497967 RepID=A0ABY4CU44_9BACT|nr:DUF4126 family protein [Hymenobacter tibetensis]UOG73708.1 DUF4126 family protein [Hymenobacter tibetensis]
MQKHFWQTVGLGTLAGFRSMTAPMLLADNLTKFHPQGLAKSPLRWLQKPWVATGLKFMTAGEMVGDKLPDGPDRTAPPVLAGRLLSGALVGATLYKLNHDSVVKGALLGGAMAVAATYGSLYLRKKSAQESGLPIALVGGFEDALVLGAGLALSKGTALGSPAGRAL